MCEHNLTFLLTPILFGTLIFSGVTKDLQTATAIWPGESSLLEIRRTAPNLRRLHDDKKQRRPKYTTDSNRGYGITPLVSSRVEVEVLFGKPVDSLGQTFIYENETDKVRVLYSNLVCEQTVVGNWNVPKDIVLKFTVYPKKIILVKTLNLDRSKFKRIREVHPENWIHYLNVDEGISVDAQIRGGREEVMSLVYEPSSEQQALRCPNDRAGNF